MYRPLLHLQQKVELNTIDNNVGNTPRTWSKICSSHPSISFIYQHGRIFYWVGIFIRNISGNIWVCISLLHILWVLFNWCVVCEIILQLYKNKFLNMLFQQKYKTWNIKCKHRENSSQAFYKNSSLIFSVSWCLQNLIKRVFLFQTEQKQICLIFF